MLVKYSSTAVAVILAKLRVDLGQSVPGVVQNGAIVGLLLVTRFPGMVGSLGAAEQILECKIGRGRALASFERRRNQERSVAETHQKVATPFVWRWTV
jgi:hypothetical protein